MAIMKQSETFFKRLIDPRVAVKVKVIYLSIFFLQLVVTRVMLLAWTNAPSSVLYLLNSVRLLDIITSIKKNMIRLVLLIITYGCI